MDFWSEQKAETYNIIAHPCERRELVQQAHTKSQQSLRQITPFWVHVCNQLLFPLALPFFQLSFSRESTLPAGMHFKPDKLFAIIEVSEPFDDVFTVLVSTAINVVCHADIEHCVSVIGHDIDAEHHLIGH